MSSDHKFHIYQLLPRLFSNTNTTNKKHGTIEENGVGKMNDISTKALTEIKNLGMSHIWYTGIIEHATQTDYSNVGIAADNPYIVKGLAGSPYAIKDYYDVCPDIAENIPNRIAEFEDLVKRTHLCGLKVIIDFVPNHLARVYKSDAGPAGTEDFGENDDITNHFDPNNNYYYLPEETFKLPEDYEPLYVSKDTPLYVEKPARVTGNDVFSASPNQNDWFETVKLNYGVDYASGNKASFEPIPDTWVKMKDILLYWSSKGVDGFRCDMIEMVPVEFWKWVTQEVKHVYEHCIFIGEAYNPDNYRPYLFQGGFDYLYDKDGFYDTIRDVMIGFKSTDHITEIWEKQEGLAPYMLRFLENHDEQRIASPYFAGNARKGIPAMALAVFMNNGPSMLYSGQELGEPASRAEGFKGDDGRTSIFDYCAIPELQKWVNNLSYNEDNLSPEKVGLRDAYKAIYETSTQYECIQSGHFYDLHWANRQNNGLGYSERVYGFLRYDENDRLLILINFNDASQEECLVQIPGHALGCIGVGTLPTVLDINSEENPAISAHEDGDGFILSLKIAPLSYKVLSIN